VVGRGEDQRFVATTINPGTGVPDNMNKRAGMGSM